MSLRRGSDDPTARNGATTIRLTATPLGLYFYPARWYDTALGMFIQADAVSGGDRYSYVLNNQLKFTDPRASGQLC